VQMSMIGKLSEALVAAVVDEAVAEVVDINYYYDINYYDDIRTFT
jgi:hypothetical protein